MLEEGTKTFSDPPTHGYSLDITERIIGCAMKVSNTLGVGYLEKVYENALVVELARAGLGVEQQKPLKVLYEGVIVGDFAADTIVNGSVLLELKAAKVIDPTHQAQLLNYLRATGIKLGLILKLRHTPIWHQENGFMKPQR